jgi:nondiscriminating glutamyl-tRNA synthetase
VFDPAKLRWTNASLLHQASGAGLRALGADFLPEAARALPAERLEAALELVRGNLTTLADLPVELGALLGDPVALEPDAAAVLADPAARARCGALAADLEALAEWSADGFKSAVLSLGKRTGVKGRDLFQPVRCALTGRTHGPELPAIAAWLGRERCLARLGHAASRTA